jgi:hypothetical protein
MARSTTGCWLRPGWRITGTSNPRHGSIPTATSPPGGATAVAARAALRHSPGHVLDERLLFGRIEGAVAVHVRPREPALHAFGNFALGKQAIAVGVAFLEAGGGACLLGRCSPTGLKDLGFESLAATGSSVLSQAERRTAMDRSGRSGFFMTKETLRISGELAGSKVEPDAVRKVAGAACWSRRRIRHDSRETKNWRKIRVVCYESGACFSKRFPQANSGACSRFSP